MIQLNPNKEYVKKGIYDIIFKQINEFGNINNLKVDNCIYQQEMNKTLWFMVEANKNQNEVMAFIDRTCNLGLNIYKLETIDWLGKQFDKYAINVADENLSRIVQNLCNLGFKDYRYYDISKKMLVEPWGG